MAINKSQVFQIADAMFAEGEQPTLIKIRTALGSGSFSTISSYLAEWKTSSRAGDVVQVGEVPDEVSDLFTSALSAMWSKAVLLGQEQSNDISEAARLQVEAVTVRLNDTLELADSIQNENSQLVDKLLSQEADLHDCRRIVDNLHLQLAQAAATEKEFRRMHSEVVNAFKSAKKVVEKKQPSKVEPLKVAK